MASNDFCREIFVDLPLDVLRLIASQLSFSDRFLSFSFVSKLYYLASLSSPIYHEIDLREKGPFGSRFVEALPKIDEIRKNIVERSPENIFAFSGDNTREFTEKDIADVIYYKTLEIFENNSFLKKLSMEYFGLFGH